MGVRQCQEIRSTTQMLRGSRETHMLLKQELLIVVNGLADSEMEMVSNNGPMVRDMKANGKTTELMVKANSLILMEMSMRETGSTTKLMDMVYIIILMVLCMKSTGERIFNMELVKRAGLMAPFTKENM